MLRQLLWSCQPLSSHFSSPATVFFQSFVLLNVRAQRASGTSTWTQSNGNLLTAAHDPTLGILRDKWRRCSLRGIFSRSTKSQRLGIKPVFLWMFWVLTLVRLLSNLLFHCINLLQYSFFFFFCQYEPVLSSSRINYRRLRTGTKLEVNFWLNLHFNSSLTSPCGDSFFYHFH